MWLIEAFILGIVAWLQALAVAVLVGLICAAAAAYVHSHRHPVHSL